MRRSSRPTVVSTIETGKFSLIHPTRSQSRQRTTPWIRGSGPLSTMAANASRCCWFSLWAWPFSLALLQPFWSLGVEAQHPLADDLRLHTGHAGSSSAVLTVVDGRQGKEAATLGSLHAPIGQTTQLLPVAVLPQRNWCSHSSILITGSPIETNNPSPATHYIIPSLCSLV